MARPTKKGLDYFPLAVDFEDTNVEMIECRYGMIGLSVIITLWQYIYKNNGYYCNYDARTALKLSRRYGDQLSAALPESGKAPHEILDEIVSSAVQYGIFDSEMFKKHNILTSKGIQERYLEATSRRKDTNMKKEYLLVFVPSKEVNVDNNSVNVCKNPVNVRNNPQSKVKESKLKKRKENDTAVPVPARASTSSARQTIIEAYENNIAPITPVVRRSLCDWLKKVDAEVIIWAVQEAAKANKPSYKYIEGILNSHFRAGRKTMPAVEAAVRSYKRKETDFDIYRDEYNHEELEQYTRAG